jgi:hypothetical protein
MSTKNIDHDFQCIWSRIKNTHSKLDELTSDIVKSYALDKKLDVEVVEECEVGAFSQTKCIVLTVKGRKACFPKVPLVGDPDWEHRQKYAEYEAGLWKKMEWFSPLWVTHGDVQELLNKVKYCSQDQAIDQFNHHTNSIYTVAFQATCIAQIMPRARSLQEYCPLVREAYLAFYSGYRASSIAALIPLIEGSLARIVSGVNKSDPVKYKFDTAINKAITLAAKIHFDEMWVPEEYLTAEYLMGQDERVFFFETFRSWLGSSFFQKTGEYDGKTWLNRHIFAHGTSALWQQTANFSRLVVALTTLAVVESFYDKSNVASFFFPEMDRDSTLLWQQALFQMEAQMVLKIIEEKRYHEHGSLVPETPTDDGALLRKALLSDECMKDLVRPLRDAGWSVEVGEPEEDGLYMTVIATCSNGETLSAALLYSCATGNEIYQKLAETSQVILYRGAPYQQESFAYGLNVHVGPVLGWQAPTAPSLCGRECTKAKKDSSVSS